MQRAFLLIVGVLGATLTPTSPAAAVIPSGTAVISVSNTFLPTSDCAYHDYSVTIRPSVEVSSWNATVIIEGPDGEPVGSDFFYGRGFAVESGDILLCPFTDEPGSYSIDVDLDVTDLDYDTWPGMGDLKFFNVRKQTPKVALQLSDRTPRRGQIITTNVRAWSAVDGDPIEYGDVALQKKSRGRWVTYPWSKEKLDRRGRTSIRGRATTSVTIRAVLRGDSAYRGATSRPITMRVRR